MSFKLEMTPCFATYRTLTSCENLPPRLEAPIMDAEAADMNAEAPADWLGGPGVPYTSITLLSLRIVDVALNFQISRPDFFPGKKQQTAACGAAAKNSLTQPSIDI